MNQLLQKVSIEFKSGYLLLFKKAFFIMTGLPKIPLTSRNDYLIIAAYFIGVLIIGFKTKSDSNSVKDYLIAGRTFDLPFVATIVASLLEVYLEIGEFTFRFGISGYFFTLPYYIFITVFAFFLANKIRRTATFIYDSR
ncbi:MAG: hypothetical protein R2942_16720 [Ignavibacteria bacterium]